MAKRCPFTLCQLCERKVDLTFHHLVPRKMHRRAYFKKHFDKTSLNNGIWICRLCHKGIHRLYDEMTLAKEFYTLDKLKQDEAVQRHVQWASKQRAKLAAG